MPKRTHRFDAILFDLDGTLADTREFLVQAYNHVLTKHGRKPLSIQRVAEFRGATLSESYSKLFPRASPEFVSSLMKEHRGFQMMNPQHVKEFSGARDALDAIRAAGIPMAIVTNRGRQTTDLILSQLGLRTYVRAVVSEGDVSTNKPHPEPFLHAKRMLGVSPDDSCLVVGDAPPDVVGGHAAGCIVARAMWGHGAKEACEENPEYSPKTFSELRSIIGV